MIDDVMPENVVTRCDEMPINGAHFSFLVSTAGIVFLQTSHWQVK